jgi:hypothetical protein
MVERVAEAVGRKRSGRPGTLTLEWKPCERDSLQVSERLSRASGPGWETDRGVPGRFDPEGRRCPEGEWRPAQQQAGLVAEAATGQER